MPSKFLLVVIQNQLLQRSTVADAWRKPSHAVRLQKTIHQFEGFNWIAAAAEQTSQWENVLMSECHFPHIKAVDVQIALVPDRWDKRLQTHQLFPNVRFVQSLLDAKPSQLLLIHFLSPLLSNGAPSFWAFLRPSGPSERCVVAASFSHIADNNWEIFAEVLRIQIANVQTIFGVENELQRDQWRNLINDLTSCV